MDINTQIQLNTSSIQQALNVSLLQKSMNKDAGSMAKLLQGMEQSSAQIQNVNPHLGNNLDVTA